MTSKQKFLLWAQDGSTLPAGQSQTPLTTSQGAPLQMQLLSHLTP